MPCAEIFLSPCVQNLLVTFALFQFVGACIQLLPYDYGGGEKSSWGKMGLCEEKTD